MASVDPQIYAVEQNFRIVNDLLRRINDLQASTERVALDIQELYDSINKSKAESALLLQERSIKKIDKELEWPLFRICEIVYEIACFIFTPVFYVIPVAESLYNYGYKNRTSIAKIVVLLLITSQLPKLI